MNSCAKQGRLHSQPLMTCTCRVSFMAALMFMPLLQRVTRARCIQEFAFYVLRNCFVVLMVARDEGASFTIFSCLNGRGMDLTVVDKLKAELLQVRGGFQWWWWSRTAIPQKWRSHW
jgi:hypothetical protein